MNYFHIGFPMYLEKGLLAKKAIFITFDRTNCCPNNIVIRSDYHFNFVINMLHTVDYCMLETKSLIKKHKQRLIHQYKKLK